MNAKLKTFLMALVLVPCAFIFAACGGDQLSQAVTVDTSGNYQTATAEQAKTAATADTTLAGVSEGVRFSMNMTTKDSVTNKTSTINAALIFKQTETETEEKTIIAIRAQTNNYTVPEMDGMSVNGKATLYYITTQPTEGEATTVAYLDADMQIVMGASNSMDIKGKFTIDTETNSELGEIAEMMTSLMFMMQMYAPDADNPMWTEEGFSYKIATNDTTTKIEVTTPEEKEGNVVVVPSQKIYFVLEDGKFVGMSTSATFGDQSASIAIAAFDGEVELPDFEGYADTYLPAAA